MKALALIVLLLYAAAPGVPHQPQLTGRIDGLPDAEAKIFDLRARFFESRTGGSPIFEHRFASVRLSPQGRFSVPLERAIASRERLYVELALRPAERQYAAFSVLRPRQPLRRTGGHRWQANAAMRPARSRDLGFEHAIPARSTRSPRAIPGRS